MEIISKIKKLLDSEPNINYKIVTDQVYNKVNITIKPATLVGKQKELYNLLKEDGCSWTPTEVADWFNINVTTARRRLRFLRKKGYLDVVDGNKYYAISNPNQLHKNKPPQKNYISQYKQRIGVRRT